MALSRKHYRRIASAISEAHDAFDSQNARDAVAQVAQNLATYFEEENPRFDSDRFYEAIGL